MSSAKFRSRRSCSRGSAIFPTRGAAVWNRASQAPHRCAVVLCSPGRPSGRNPLLLFPELSLRTGRSTMIGRPGVWGSRTPTLGQSHHSRCLSLSRRCRSDLLHEPWRSSFAIHSRSLQQSRMCSDSCVPLPGGSEPVQGLKITLRGKPDRALRGILPYRARSSSES